MQRPASVAGSLIVDTPACRGILAHVRRTADDLPLLFRADVFLLPSMHLHHLHTMSMLRAAVSG